MHGGAGAQVIHSTRNCDLLPTMYVLHSHISYRIDFFLNECIKGECLFGNGRGRMSYLGAGKWYFRVEWVYTVYCIKDSVFCF